MIEVCLWKAALNRYSWSFICKYRFNMGVSGREKRSV